MKVRLEQATDAGSIRAVVLEAFAQATHSSGTEHLIVDQLREKGALTLSLVAVESARIIGHVAVSPVIASEAPGTWFGLGPVSVQPSCQGRGVGSALIDEALDHLRHSGASGCVVLGDPDYYGRFGFQHDPRVSYRDAPPPYFQVLSFGTDQAAGPVEYDAAFEATG
jgi:predicted N-acetyltransferase YhbS